MALQANNRNLLMRNERTMPAWVTEQSGRIGPKPPPPPLTQENGHVPQKQPALPPKINSQPEPDYEVIEFSNQQYSNTPLRPSSASSGSKTPDSKLKCTLCGSGNPWVTCEECSQQIFCASCDDMFHKHPKRKLHQRKTLEQTIPPLPPKVLPGQPGPSPPVAPPRRNKRGLMTPLMQRKDQMANSAAGPFAIPPSPTPSLKNASWQDRMGSLKRGLSILNRPLPDTPKTPTTPSESSRCTTPKSAFDTIQKPPSVVLEKIKNKANATLDRMQLLQQRYRQQKEQIERDRNGNHNDQNVTAFDQWSSISPSPSHFRSGSMSSGINSSHLDLTDDSSFNLFHQRQMALQHHHLAAQRANQLGQRGMSSSVFNLNQMHRKPPVMTNGWINHSMQQAQSMAQLNCANCSQSQQPPPWGGQQHMHMPHDPWSNQLSSQQQLNRSNLSLNVSAGYMLQPPHNGMYPPPVFMNQRVLPGQMYPQPYMGGMPVMNPGLSGMPPSASRAASRAGSRMASPAMSRKSVTLRRKQRSSYREDEGTDDEDSDEDDRRSMVSNRSGMSRSRQRRMSSASQIQMEDDMEAISSKHQRSRVRSHRRDSVAKSVHNDWAPGKKSSNGNNRSVDSGFNSPLKPSRVYSDLDSEGSGTRALVQAKIEQKLKEESLKQQKQSKSKRGSESPPKQKLSAAVQTPAAQTKSKEVKEKTPPTESETGDEKEVEEVVQVEVTDEESEEEAEEEIKAPEPQPDQITAATDEHDNTVEDQDEDEVSLGPPPSTPDQEWECEFCTFVNEPNIKICSICCKTPCKPPKLIAKSVSPPKQVKSPIKDKDKSKDKSGTLKYQTPTESNKTNEVNGIQSDTTVITISSASAAAAPAPAPARETAPAPSLKVDSSQSTDDTKDNKDTGTLKSTKTLTKKESVEDIWATLDENIQATAHEVARKAESSQKPTKVSTGCGTSSKSASVERQDVAFHKTQAREIGTSPPPQTISTQTYESLTLRNAENKEEPPQPPSAKTSSSQPVPNDTLIQQSNFPSSQKIHDLKSFENEVLNNIHNISHIPSQYPYQHQHQHQQSFYPSHDRHQRYRSNNDLRMDDNISVDFDSYNGMGRRHPSISELLLLQRTSSQMHSPFTGSSYDLSYRHSGMDNHKESDLYKHTTEELNAALKYCGPDMHPLVWLRDNWPKLIQTVQSLATKYGQERAENTIGTISQMEAREALRMHTGNIWQAVSECIEQRQRKYREISNKGNFSREDIVTALTTHQGNVDLALMDLGRTQLKPFLMRIWGSPGGVENESGSMIIPPVSQSAQNEPYAMDKDIHNFLSANASDCMQFPNTTGAFTPNNQTPSPFDLPTTLTSNPYDINSSSMPDNTSSYSADSNKDFAPSPLQVDDAILNNKGMLKDLETLIGTMEQNQQKQNEQVLRSIQDMINNMKQDKNVDDYDPESMRILTKSPITTTKFKNPSKEKTTESEEDVKNFVWQHIQEIVPNLVQQVEMELREDNVESAAEAKATTVGDEEHIETVLDSPKEIPPPPPPIDQDEFLMEEVIKPNLRNANIREELPPQYVYAAEIATFQMAFDKALQREHKQQFQFDSLADAERLVFKMYKDPEPHQQTPTVNEAKSVDVQNIPVTVEDIPTISPEAPKLQTPESLATNAALASTDIPTTVDNLSTQAIGISSGHIESEVQETSTTFAGITISTTVEETNTPIIPENIQNKISELPISNSGMTAQTIKSDVIQNNSHETVAEENSPVESLSPKETAGNTANTDDSISLSSVVEIKPESTPSNSAVVKTKPPSSIPVSTGRKTPLPPSTTPEPVNTAQESTKDTLASEPKDITKVGEKIDPNASADVPHVNSPTSTEIPTENNDTASNTPREAQMTASESENSEIPHPSSSTQSQEAKPSHENKDQSPKLETNNTLGNKENTEVSTSPNVPHVLSPIPNETTELHKENRDAQTNVETKSTLESDDQKLEGEKQPVTQSSNERKGGDSEGEKLPVTQSSNQRKTSKIPVRRTLSNKSLISTPTALPKPEVSHEPPAEESTAAPQPTTKEMSPSTSVDVTDLPTDDDSEEELYSLASETSSTDDDSHTEIDSRLGDVQSPTSTNEMFLMIQHEGGDISLDESTVVPSTSTSTVHSAANFPSGLKSPPEFVPSGDPNKQNLSELVKDTQRLIKQMKEEISIDDFESSTDDDYSEDYSDDFEEEEDDEEGEEEEEEDEEDDEDDDENWEDDVEGEDEYEDVIDDIMEEDEMADSQREETVDTHTPEQLDTHDHRELHNASELSNASMSSKHSQLSLSSDHVVNNIPPESNQTMNSSNLHEESNVETQNNTTEIPVEANVSSQESPSSSTKENTMAFVETESTLAEMPVETVLSEPPETAEKELSTAQPLNETTSKVEMPSTPISIQSAVETENSLPELPHYLMPTTEILPQQTENVIPELPVEVVLPIEPTVDDETPQSQSSTNNNATNASSPPIITPSNVSSPSNNDHELPSTSGSVLSSTEQMKNLSEKTVKNVESQKAKVHSVNAEKPGTSKQTAGKSKLTDSKTKTSDEPKTPVKKPVAASKIPKPKDNPKEPTPKDSRNTNATAPPPTPPTAARVHNEPKKKLPMRSKSFSGPPTPIGISSVKTISQRFIGQSQQKNTQPQIHKAPTTIARKPSITEAINKLTKTTTSKELPSTSSLFKARTQPRIPKKKYHETCFSDDDYETTSTEEEPEPLEIRQRKMSIPVFRAYPSVQEPEEIKTEELVDKFVKEELVSTIAEAQIAAALVSMKFPQDVSLWAAKECSDLDHAVALLKQECELCSGTYALNEIVSMLKCTHKCCKDCAKTYFTVQITERSINDCNCPFCKTPDLHNQTELEDENLEYFSNLDIFLKNIVEPEVHELFQRKLRDRTLLKDPNFKWCVQCSSGFFARPKQKRLICPDCGSVTCASCRKPWQKQHEGISCEKFLEWQMGNDPEVQALGVQQHLEQNGIDCPKCKFRYSLARGGCMHFTCTQCKFEFCYGCAKPFMMGAKCTISAYCAKLGLHAHHPRNCLFYLRDKLPIQLQILLKNNGVAFEVDPIVTNNDDNEPGSSQKQALYCPIPIQKETPTGLVDTKCKADVPDKHAGMCRTHYVEYLTAKVAKAKIDPLPIFDLTDCVQELRRRGIPLPERGPWDTDEIYKTMCAEVIQKNIPLDAK